MAVSIDEAELMKVLAMAANEGGTMEQNGCKLLREANEDQGKVK
jgi:hypothetical protein